MEQAVQIFDWERLLVGDEPPLFFLEILFRTLFVYIYTMILLRWLGSRTIGQLSSIEFLLVIALGSAVGDAMFYPDVPLLHALAVITIVVFANKGLDLLVSKSRRAEVAVDGKPLEAIRDGTINRSFLEGVGMTNLELFQQLRANGVEDLGQVRRAYLETNGTLSVFKTTTAPRGLPIIPPWEIQTPTTLSAGDTPGRPGKFACERCGQVKHVATVAPPGKCSNCAHQTLVVLGPDEDSISAAGSTSTINFDNP